jgi:hypothetical protein
VRLLGTSMVKKMEKRVCNRDAYGIGFCVEDDTETIPVLAHFAPLKAFMNVL